jgi:protein-L-isoaspartate O-methyltransferase
MSYRLTDEQIEHGIELLLKDKPELMGTCLNAIYQDLDGSKAAEEFHAKHMTPSCGVITVFQKKRVMDIMNKISTDIYGKTIVEIGAGVGLLAIAMATISEKVYAIESDPAWSWAFTKIMYEIKPPNLTFIFGKAENMVGLLKADVAIIVTRSGHEGMQNVANKLANKAIDVYEQYEID